MAPDSHGLYFSSTLHIYPGQERTEIIKLINRTQYNHKIIPDLHRARNMFYQVRRIIKKHYERNKIGGRGGKKKINRNKLKKNEK